MKTRTFVIILTTVFAVLIIIGGCATTSKIKEERGSVKPEIFFQSVKSGDYAEVKRLIEEGVNVNAQTKARVLNRSIESTYTALMWASIMGHTEVAKLFF